MGHPPYLESPGEDGQAVLGRVRAGPPAPVGYAKAVDPALAALCEQAMARRREDRLPDASMFVVGLERWGEASRRRIQANNLVLEAGKLGDQAQAHRAEAGRLRDQAAMLLVGVRTWDTDEMKLDGWALQDAAELSLGLADEAELHMRWRLEAALAAAPDHEAAHAALADYHRERHVEAETRRDVRAAAIAMAQLRRHDTGAHRAYVDGDAWLSLSTAEPAAARLLRFVTRGRRLHADFERELGPTPVIRERLGVGSWLVELRPVGGPVLRLPVWLAPEAHWELAAPLALPAAGELGPDDVWVAGGPCWLGGDPEAYSPLERGWVDLPCFVMERYPVTQARYLEFLNDLVRRDREDEALLFAPRERPTGAGGEGNLLYGRRDGLFHLKPDAEGDVWSAEWPVMMVNFAGAQAFAAWYSRRTRRPWRVPNEREWEKAARGVDGRWFPWGDFLDPSWCRIASSQKARALPVDVTEYPTDESPYGIRGLGGNMRCWCADAFTTSGDGAPAVPDDPNLPRVVRGGSFFFSPIGSRAASRYQFPQTNRTDTLGIRLVRSWP